MNFVYSSYEGKLGVDNQSGYNVYELADYYEIHLLSVFANKDEKFRISKEKAPDDWTRFDIGSLVAIKDGAEDGQYFFNNRWYGKELINKIQKEKRTYNWMATIY